jgi:hypothetical protein
MAAADVNLSLKVQGDEIVVPARYELCGDVLQGAGAFPQQLLTKSPEAERIRVPRAWNAADAFGLLAIAYEEPAAGRRQPIYYPKVGYA